MTFRYRRLDRELDMTFGRGGLDYIVDTPEAVAQSIYTRLCLWQEEWFLDITEGTPWMQQILAHPPDTHADAAIRARIVGTPFVVRLYDYASFYDPTMRTFTISCKVITAFGEVTTAPPGTVASPSGALVMVFGGPAVVPPPPQQVEPPRLQLPRAR